MNFCLTANSGKLVLLTLLLCIVSLYYLHTQSATFFQSIDVSAYRGKKFRLQAAVKVIAEDQGSRAQLWAGVDGKGVRTFFYNMSDRPVTSSSWAVYSFEGEIAQEAIGMMFGALMYFNGQFYFDDFQLSIETEPDYWKVIPITNGGFEERPGKNGSPPGWSVPTNRKGFSTSVGRRTSFRGRQALEVSGQGVPTPFQQLGSFLDTIVRQEQSGSHHQNVLIQQEEQITNPSADVFGNHRIERLPIKESGIGNRIGHVLKDSKGFIWFVSSYYLVRYDGYNFKKFSIQDSLVFFGPSGQYDIYNNIIEDINGNIWFTARSAGVIQFDPKKERFTQWQAPQWQQSYPSAITSDSSGKIYANYRGGLIRITSSYQGQAQKAGITIDSIYIPSSTSVDKSSTLIPNEIIHDLFTDGKGHIWVATMDGLSRIFLNNQSGQIIRIENFGGPFETNALYDDLEIIDCSVEQHEISFFVKERGSETSFISSLNYQTKCFEVNKLPGVSWRFRSNLTKDRYGTIWLDNWDGVFFKAAGRDFQLFEPLQSPTHCLWSASDGVVWVGTQKSGLNKISRVRENTMFYPIKTSAMRVHFPIVMAEDSLGNLWVRFSEKGLYHLDRMGNILRRAPISYLSMMYSDQENDLWLWAYINPAYLVKNARQFHIGDEANNYLTFGPVFTETPDGKLLARISAKKDSLYPTQVSLYYALIEKASPHRIKKIEFEGIDLLDAQHRQNPSLFDVDENGNCWVVNGDQLYQLRYDSSAFFSYVKTHFFRPSFKHCTQIFNDGEGKLWLATIEGLLSFDTRLHQFTLYEDTKGLSNPDFMISMDRRGFLWLIGSSGNYRFDRQTGLIDYYFKLPMQEVDFQNGTSLFRLQLHTGEIFIPAKNGFYLFDPDDITPDTVLPRPVITEFWVNDKNLQPDTGAFLSENIAYIQNIQLDYDENNLTIEFSGLHYLDSEKNQYAVLLDGWEKAWNYIGTSHSTRYVNLSPGHYTFKVKAANADGIWNEEHTSLGITIRPPWYWAWYAKTIYLLVLLAGLFALYRFLLNRRLQLAETHRLLELDRIKTRLYTNISHEFRTPLTVIQGVTDQIAAEAASLKKPRIQKNAHIVKRNGAKLLSLVNQMLDLRKLESGNLPVHMIQGDILLYLKYILESFHSLAEAKDIRLHFVSEEAELLTDYDPAKMQHIISNLLSNAIKFTPKGGEVCLLARIRYYQPAEEKTLEIQVRDTGIGIPADQMPHIFDRFYQVDNISIREAGRLRPYLRQGGAAPTEGTGIGLTLTRELVKLLGGEIGLESQVGKGTTFHIWLPIRRTAPLIGKLPAVELASAENMPAKTDATERISASSPAHLVLIIEDNRDVADYIRSCLESSYQIELALTGQEGIDKAIELVPDLIISDVMMPEKDGFEVTQTLKNDTRTSHVPIVLLTAKADVESRLAGLSRGADAYLAKPFHKEELLIRMEQLIALRKRLRKRYENPAAVNEYPVGRTSEDSLFELEDVFMQKVCNHVEENLANPAFGNEELCRAMALSRTQLFRKLKALTGVSVVVFIRFCRLKKARELLIKTELNVSEIAYETGFTDPSYFGRIFKREFGMTPIEFRGAKKTKE